MNFHQSYEKCIFLTPDFRKQPYTSLESIEKADWSLEPPSTMMNLKGVAILHSCFIKHSFFHCFFFFLSLSLSSHYPASLPFPCSSTSHSFEPLWSIIKYVRGIKVLWNANACWLVLIFNTLIITNMAKRLFKYMPYILL